MHFSSALRRATQRLCVPLLSIILLASSATSLAQQGNAASSVQGISASAMSQISALLAEKESRTKTQQKIDSQLIYGARIAASREAAPGVSTLELHLRYLPLKGRPLVEIDVRTNVLDKANAIVAARIIALGGTIIADVPQFNSIHAALPIEQVEALAALEQVRFIGSAPVRESDVGSVTSEGDRTHAADTARTTYSPYMGNVRICVISDSATAAGIANSVANGNLAAGQVTVLPGQEGSGSNEGLAMLEIVNDLAPGAKLYFATSGSSEATFAQNILGLYNSYKCDVMVDDIRFGSELPFQDSVIARAVNTVTAAGTIYFASAGNSGNKTDGTSGTWVGDFVNGGAFTVPGSATSYEVHSFQTSPSVQNYNVVNTGGSSYSLSLFWSDPENASSNDYDVFQLNSTGTAVVSSSTTTQNGTQTPFEFATLSATGGNRVVVVRKTGAASRALYVSTGRGRLAINTNGFARGHSAAIDAIAAAAVPAAGQFNGASPTGPYPGTYTAAQLTEIFSSDGPARKFHHPNGTPVTPGNFLIGTGGGLTQQYPVITAADGVTTSVSGFAPFYGTSAAAPHAAAMAGLLKGFNPTLTAAQIRNALVSTALDIEAPGVDSDTGAGIIRPMNALATLTASPFPFAGTAPAPSSESFAPSNGFVDPGETVTINLPVINGGSAAFGNLVATLQSSANVTPLAVNPQNYGAIAAAGTTVSRPFSFTASGTCGDTFPLTLQIQDGATSYGTITYPVTLGTTQTTATLLENFDGVTAPALPSGWTSTVVQGTVLNWVTSTTTPDTAPNSISANPLATESEVRLDSPSYAIPATGNQQLRFRHRWNTESGWDGGVLEISIAGGPFADIIAAGGSFVSGGYTAVLGTGTGSSTLAGRSAWSGSSNSAYTTTVVTLPAAALGQNINLRFRLASDSSTLASGTNVWRIDTLERTTTTLVCATGSGVATSLALSATGPIHRGQQSTVTATVTAVSGTATGSVAVSGAGGSCNVSLAGGTGTCALTPTTVGVNQALAGSYTPGAGFQGSSGGTTLTVKSALDVDDNGQSDATADGVLALRHLFGLRDSALVSGITFGGGAQRTSPAAISAYLASVSSVLDVDGNGQVSTMTDGVMLIRYLLGLRGAALVQGATGAPGATRTTSGDLENYIGGLIQ